MDESQTIRVSVEEAATLLSIEKNSVKKRIQRSKLRAEKDASEVTWVYLDRSETVRDQSQRRSETDRDELVGELRDRVRSLERRLDDEGESRRRADTIIAQLTQANTALNERLRELEALQTSEKATQDAAEAVAKVPPAMPDARGATEDDNEPRWAHSKWANWLIPALLGYGFPILIPLGIAALGAVWVYIRVNRGEVVLAIIGAIVTLVAVVLSLFLVAALGAARRIAQDSIQRLERIRDATQDRVDKMNAEMEQREAWLKEQDPEAVQRVKDLTEEYEREHQPPSPDEGPLEEGPQRNA